MPIESERSRMIVDLPSDVQMAIRLRAVKSNSTIGEVVCEAVTQSLGKDIEEARAVLAEKKPNTKRHK
jgi:hypothetical protein